MGAARAVGLLLGVAADTVFKDPVRLHPVAGFGRLAASVERGLYADNRPVGVAYSAVLVGGAMATGLALERLARRHPWLQAGTTALATWTVVGGASLAAEGTAMAQELDCGDIDAARTRLPHLCGRDADRLDIAGLSRASVESIAENTSDAVVAPLVWGALAGVPGLLAYRAANTLDAMVGYRAQRYRRFGWSSARLDDLVNLLPSRLAAALAVASAPAVGGSARGGWQVWRRDAGEHPSPNAGQVEAAFAGALGIRLGGPTPYRYGLEDRPVLGHGPPPDPADLARSVTLSRTVGTVAAALCAAAALVVQTCASWRAPCRCVGTGSDSWRGSRPAVSSMWPSAAVSDWSAADS
ncbi:MAG: cobalamin biosynthesis protein [Pseudonocardiaceae bacterium]|nr:cobalamin biosynthesis protein [Pseudonocardiaceae bacterium]